MAVVPFLGPVIAAWIIVAIVVMAYYFLVVVRNHGHGDAVERPGPAEPWPAPRSAPRLEPARYENYDMENFPDDNWRATA